MAGCCETPFLAVRHACEVVERDGTWLESFAPGALPAARVRIGNSYTANVTGLTVRGPDATLSFVITSTTTPYAFVGETAAFVLHDGGEPGVGHDYISNSSWTSPTITAGNLQVHA